ncbi:MAG: lipocalin family protein [Dysgonomonas sp.]
MKKINLFLFSVFMVLCLFTACGDDEKDESLIGKWKYEKIEVDFKTNSSSIYDALIKKQIEQQFNAQALGQVIEFTNDGKFIADGESSDYKVDGDKLTMPYDDGYMTVNFSIKGKKLVLYLDVKSEFEEEIYEQIPDLGDIKIERAIVRMSFEKQ